jgi:SAM-dependent methyltransferase
MSGRFAPALERFRTDYAAHRASEGRALTDRELRTLPYLATGPTARQWAVRARTFEAFMRSVVAPMARAAGRPLDMLDLGAGNGWLAARLAFDGHRGLAVDIRDDDVDGLGAARTLLDGSGFERVVANFDALPVADRAIDIAAFNASLHYSTGLATTLAEAARVVRPGGKIAVLDSPFYRRSAQGEAMVAEKHEHAAECFGGRAGNLLALPFIEFLTRDALLEASYGLGLVWRRYRIAYPLWYELRPLAAALRRRRAPSRFDLWVADVQ